MTRHRTRPRTQAKGRIGDNREAWVRCDNHELIHYDYSDTIELSDGTVHELIAHVLMIHSSGRGRPWSIDLTSLTSEELEAFGMFINRTIDMARPVCAAYDQIAKEALESHADDTFIRLYRGVPRMVVRERAPAEHGEGLPSGPDGPARGDGGDAAPGAEPEDGAVPHEAPSGVGAEDAATEAGSVPEVRLVGGDDDVPA